MKVINLNLKCNQNIRIVAITAAATDIRDVAPEPVVPVESVYVIAASSAVVSSAGSAGGLGSMKPNSCQE